MPLRKSFSGSSSSSSSCSCCCYCSLFDSKVGNLDFRVKAMSILHRFSEPLLKIARLYRVPIFSTTKSRPRTMTVTAAVVVVFSFPSQELKEKECPLQCVQSIIPKRCGIVKRRVRLEGHSKIALLLTTRTNRRKQTTHRYPNLRSNHQSLLLLSSPCCQCWQ